LKRKLLGFISMVLVFVLATGSITFVPAWEEEFVVEPASTGVNFAQLLQYSLFFFDSNMCGPEVNSRAVFAWRHNCHLQDMTASPYPAISEMPTVDVSGGFHDAGDHVKFGLPQSYSAVTLGWAVYEFREAFEENGLTPHAQRILDHFAEYFRRSTHWNTGGTAVTRFFYQVGDGGGGDDHGFWGPPQYQTVGKTGGNRRAYWTDATSQNPGTDQIAFAAAALAMNYLNFKNPEDLRHSLALYRFAWDGHRGLATRGTSPFYTSSRWDDKLALAAQLLFIATGEQTFRNNATSLIPSGWAHHTNWQLAWDGVWQIVNVLREDWEANRSNLARVRDNINLDFFEPASWGNTRYNSGFQMLGLIHDARRGQNVYSDWAARQMDFILGNNPHGRSFVIGIGPNPANNPTRPHHRAATGFGGNTEPNGNGWARFEANEVHEHLLTGALVGGPINQVYSNHIRDYTYTEVAIDFNASLAGAAAGLWMRHKSHQPDPPSAIPGDFRPELLLGGGDFAKLNTARAALTWSAISNGPQDEVTINLTLPANIGDVAVSWVSNNPAISNTGVVTRQTSDATGTLVATLTYGVASATVTFNPTVLLLQDPTVIRNALRDRIAYANERADETVVSVNGADVPYTLDWVTPSVMSNFHAAIANAYVVYNESNATALELTNALNDLNTAISAFKNDRTHGLYGYVPHFAVTITDGHAPAGQSGEGEYPEGARVEVSAGTRDDSYFFNGWSGADAQLLANSNASITYFTMPAREVNLTATWVRIGGGDTFPMTLRAAVNDTRLTHARFANGHAQDGSPSPNRPTEALTGNHEALHQTVTEPGDFTLILTVGSLWNIQAGTASSHWPEFIPNFATGGRVVHVTVDADGYVSIVPTSGGTFDGVYYETGFGRVSTSSGSDDVYISYGEGYPSGHTPGSPPSGAVDTFQVTITDSNASVTGAGNFPAGRTVAINAGKPSGLFVFTGWTSDSPGVSFTNAANSITTFVMPENDVNVKANWSMTSPVYRTVTFELNGGRLVSGNLEQTVINGNGANPPDVERDGWIFNGWDGVYTNVISDRTITARWRPDLTGVTIGDLTGNGRITSTDATVLARYLITRDLGGPESIEIDYRAADINCDGYVDIADVIHLARWLVGHLSSRCPNTNCGICGT